jgi:orotate phosphoribosyltransferase
VGYNKTMSVDGIEQLRALMQKYCVQRGEFMLASGRKGNYYYNGKRVTLRPSGAKLIGEALTDVVLASGPDAVGGPELGAVPIAMAVGLAALDRGRDLPIFVVRRAQKDYGARDLVVEPYHDEGASVLIGPGRRVAMVEDAVTTGGSVQKAIDAVEELGAEVGLIVVLVERHEGGAEALRAKGYDTLSLFRSDENGQLATNPAFLERRKSAEAVLRIG